MPFNQLKFKGMHGFRFLWENCYLFQNEKKILMITFIHSISDVSSTEITFSGKYLKSILEMDWNAK